jgi:hypothetical protein
MWANAMYPYMKNWNIWSCPSGTDINLFGEPESALGPTKFSFMINAYVNMASSTSVDSAADTVLFLEGSKQARTPKYFTCFPLAQQQSSDNAVPYHWDVNANYITVFTYQISTTWFDHQQGYTNSYVDGHAKYTRTPGVQSDWTKTDQAGVPTFAVPVGINLKGYYIGGFWFLPQGMGPH